MTATLESIGIDPAAKELIFDAHTAYAFSPEPLPEWTLAAIYDLIKYSPTGFNMQPLRLFPVTGEAKETLISHLMEGNRDRTVAAPLTVIIAADTNFHDLLPEHYPIFPGARDFFLDDDARKQVAIQQTWLQMGYFILGARSLGLAVGPMNGMDASGIDRDLLPADHHAIAVVNIGYPGENAYYPRNPRLDADKVITPLK